ncbi:MAG: hypothetical protein FWC50_04085 [Planctomycetaceae bacterium]|nr:hypothetical protein [Planctomycetaceae bacterium]
MPPELKWWVIQWWPGTGRSAVTGLHGMIRSLHFVTLPAAIYNLAGDARRHVWKNVS